MMEKAFIIKSPFKKGAQYILPKEWKEIVVRSTFNDGNLLPFNDFSFASSIFTITGESIDHNAIKIIIERDGLSDFDIPLFFKQLYQTTATIGAYSVITTGIGETDPDHALPKGSLRMIRKNIANTTPAGMYDPTGEESITGLSGENMLKLPFSAWDRSSSSVDENKDATGLEDLTIPVEIDPNVSIGNVDYQAKFYYAQNRKKDVVFNGRFFKGLHVVDNSGTATISGLQPEACGIGARVQTTKDPESITTYILLIGEKINEVYRIYIPYGMYVALDNPIEVLHSNRQSSTTSTLIPFDRITAPSIRGKSIFLDDASIKLAVLPSNENISIDSIKYGFSFSPNIRKSFSYVELAVPSYYSLQKFFISLTSTKFFIKDIKIMDAFPYIAYDDETIEPNKFFIKRKISGDFVYYESDAYKTSSRERIIIVRCEML